MGFRSHVFLDWSDWKDECFFAFVSVNWCQHWFEYFPNPPINVLSMVENVLGHHDRYLLQHFVTYGVTSQVSHMTPWPLPVTALRYHLRCWITDESWVTMTVTCYNTITGGSVLVSCIGQTFEHIGRTWVCKYKDRAAHIFFSIFL